MVIKNYDDGDKVIPLDAVSLPANRSVELHIPEHYSASQIPDSLEEREALHLQMLLDMGLIKKVVSRPKDAPRFTPVKVKGKPISQIIIEERS